MPRTLRLGLLFVFGLLLVQNSARAQSGVNVQFRVMALNGDVTGVAYKSGNKYYGLPAKNNAISKTVYTYAGPSLMTLYRKGSSGGGPVATGNVDFSAAVAAGANRCLVILVQTGDTVAGGAIPDTNQSFPFGSYRVYNATTVPLTFGFNDDPQVQLQAGQYSVVKAKHQNMGLNIYYTDKMGAQNQLAGNVYASQPNVRDTLVIVLSNADQMASDPNTLPGVSVLDFQETKASVSHSSDSDEPLGD